MAVRVKEVLLFRHVKDFTPAEFDKLWHAIEKMESYKEGSIADEKHSAKDYCKKQALDLSGLEAGGGFVAQTLVFKSF